MDAKPFDVVVAGNAGIDTAIYLHSDKVDFSRETDFSENLDYVGQSGGYSSRGFAQLGKKTTFIGAVGDDALGHFLWEELAGDGIDLSGLFIDSAGTNRSVNIMYPDGTRHSFFDGKSHMTLQPDLEKCRHLIAQSRLVHFSIPNWARLLLPLVKDAGIPLACDIQDVVTPDDPYRQDFINTADILFFSATNYDDPKPFIHAFLARNSKQVVICGMGSRGCMLGSSAGIRHFPPIEMIEPVIDTTGAGDALAVGFLSSYVLDGYSLTESIMRGQITARYTCTQRAASGTLITSLQLEAFFAELV